MSATKMNSLVLFLVASCLLAVAFASVAQSQILCKAEVNRNSVPVGGDVILTVTAEGSVDWSADFNIPSIPGVSIRAGGTNQSMTFINGRSRTTISQTYYLHVEKKVDFVIGSIVVKSGKETGRSNPVSITVTGPNNSTGLPPAYSGNRVPGPSASGGKKTVSGSPEIFVTLEVDRDDVWVGQQVILTFKYWHRGQSWASPNYNKPRTEGFWQEDLGQERTTNQSHNGWSYKVTEIKYAIFPTRSGTLTVEPAVLQFSGSSGSFFGSRRRAQAPRVFRTDPVEVHVKPLPLPRPPGYSGIAATSLELVAKTNRPDVPVGESVTYSLEVLTDGFLKGFAGFDIKVPEGCRLHDGAENLEPLLGGNRQDGAQKLIGRFTQEAFIVPGSEGDLAIPIQEIVWFNVRTGKYHTKKTAIQNISVTPGKAGAAGSGASGFLRTEIERLGQDLAFIRQAPNNVAMGKPAPPATALYWICMFLPVMALAGWRLYLNKLSSDRKNPANVRRGKALAIAQKAIKSADILTSTQERTGALTRIASGYVADVLDRPQASVGGKEIRGFCDTLGLEDHGRKLEIFMHESDDARYGGAASSCETSASELFAWLSDLDAAFKKKGQTHPKNPSKNVLPILMVLCLGFLSASPVLAAPEEGSRPGPDPLRLLAEGNHAYTAGDISLAVDLYTQARANGADDSVLHYNLGNAHARQGQLGFAVASYLRARRISPLDKDINSNLQWIRSQLKDLELQDSSLPFFIAQAVTFIGWFTLAQWSFVPLLLVWILAVQLGWGWYRNEFSDNLRKLLIVSMALFVMSAAVTGWRFYLEEVRNQAVIVVTEAPVHSGPSDTYPVLFEVHDGLTVNLKEYRDGWVRMNLGGKWQGWVPIASVESVRQPEN